MVNLRRALSRVSIWWLTLPTTAVLVPIHGFGLFLWWAAGSYLGADVFASVSFFGNDGWCDPQSQGLGVHCWGDYYYPIHLLGKDNPFDNSQPNPYPAASLGVFVIFDALGEVLGGGRAGLILYLISMAVAIAGGVWVGTKGQELNHRIVLTSCLTWLAPPALIAMDRGNSAGFLVAGLVWFFAALNSNKKVQQISAIVLLSIVKPHFAILAVVYAVRGHVITATQALVVSGLVHILAFALLRPQGFPLNLLQWVEGVAGYQGYATVAVPWGPNLSFAQSFYAVVFGLEQLGFPISNGSLSSIELFQGAIGPSVLAFVIIGLYFSRSVVTANQSAAILMAAITFGSATTFAYYALIVVPILLDLEARKNMVAGFNETFVRNITTHKKIDLLIWTASILSLVQLPFFGFQIRDKILTSYTLVGFAWFFCFAFVFSIVALHKVNERRRKT